MWARITEFYLACWLAMSRFIFGTEDPFWQMMDLLFAFLFASIALLSFHPKLDKIHLLHYPIIACLFGITFSHGYPLPPYLENYQMVAFIYLMTALIPSHSQLPPKAWRRFFN